MEPNTLQSFKKTNKMLFGSIFCVIVAGFLYSYVYITIAKTTTATISIQEEVSVLQSQEAEVEKLKKNFASTNAQQQTISSYFVDMSNPVPFFETIESYGKNTGVKTTFENVTVKKDPKQLTASLTVAGSFSGLYQFLQLLEAAPYEFSIRSTTLQAGVVPEPDPSLKNPPKASKLWEAHIVLVVYGIVGTK